MNFSTAFSLLILLSIYWFDQSNAKSSGGGNANAAINCDFESETKNSPGCPFRFFVSELPFGTCSVEREWCMMARFDPFHVTENTTTCRNNKATVNKCDSWGLCKKLMKGKTENRGCFVKNSVTYTNPTNGRRFEFPQVYIYCCKSSDRCNHPSRYGQLSSCSQLPSWPPTN